MGGIDRRMMFFAFLIASYFQDAAQIIIKEQKVPLYVLVGKEPFIVLDCDYDLEKTPIEGLVVKWWHNENDQVYQWIYGNKPQALGIVEKYIDLSHNASSDPETMYRAMKLVNPGIDLNGDYTCTVSTTADEDTQTKPMVVYATGKLKLKPRKTTVNGVDGVELTCHAEGVYPRPTLDVSIDGTPVAQSPLLTDGADKRYNITTRVEFKDSDIPNPASLTCVLGIPAANYTFEERELYHPGPPTTTTTTTSSTTMQRKMDNQVLRNSQPVNGGGNKASSISNELIIMLVSITAASAASRF